MKKIICDACGEEIFDSPYQEIGVYSKKARIGREGYDEIRYFLKLELHPECARAIECVIKEDIDKFIDKFPHGGKKSGKT